MVEFIRSVLYNALDGLECGWLIQFDKLLCWSGTKANNNSLYHHHLYIYLNYRKCYIRFPELLCNDVCSTLRVLSHLDRMKMLFQKKGGVFPLARFV